VAALDLVAVDVPDVGGQPLGAHGHRPRPVLHFEHLGRLVTRIPERPDDEGLAGRHPVIAAVRLEHELQQLRT
jgi:hypothetical protein